MVKKITTFYTICVLFLIFSAQSFGQGTEVSSEPLWMLILPETISESADQERENKITDMVVDIAWESGRFEVFDRYDVRDLLLEYQPFESGYLPDSVVIAIGDCTTCDEALLIDLVSFSQIGIPPADDGEEEEDRNFLESIIDGLFSSDSEDYSDNIHTRLTVQFRNLNLITREEIDRFSISVSHTGGTKPESEEETLSKFRDMVFSEVRMIYQLISEVVAVDGVDLDLRLGANLGITGNTLFEIIEPDRIITEGEEEVLYSGTPVGLVCVKDVSDTLNRSRVIRQWDAIEPGYYACEYNSRIDGFQLFFLPKFPGEYLYMGGQYHYSPLGTWDFGGGIHYFNVTDSYDENDNGLGFGLFGARRLFTMTSLSVYARAGINLDIPFKEDDDGMTVNTGVFSGSLGLSCNLMLSKKADVEINLGYRQSTKSSDWTFSENEEEFDAFWYDEAPVVDLSGFYFTLGYKFILF